MEYDNPLLGGTYYGDFPIHIPDSGGERTYRPDGTIIFHFFNGRDALYDQEGNFIRELIP